MKIEKAEGLKYQGLQRLWHISYNFPGKRALTTNGSRVENVKITKKVSLFGSKSASKINIFYLATTFAKTDNQSIRKDWC